MNQLQEIKCPNNLPAIKVCSNSQCKQFCFMCNDQECGCHKHEDCQWYSLNSIITKLETKGRSLLPLYQTLAQWHENTIKQFTINLQQIRNTIQQHKVILEGDQAILYQLLKDRKLVQVTPFLISRVLNSLKEQNQNSTQDKIAELNISLKKRQIELRQILLKTKSYDQIKNSLKNKTKLESKFSTNLCHSSLTLTNDNRNLKLKKCTDQYVVGLLEEPVEKFGFFSQIYRFRIVKSRGNFIMFGLCYLDLILKSKFLDSSDLGCLGYEILGSGDIFSVNKQKLQRSSKCITKIQANEILQMQYNPMKEILQFRNVSKKESDILEVRSQPGNPLYPCVMMYDADDQVEIVNMQILE